MTTLSKVCNLEIDLHTNKLTEAEIIRFRSKVDTSGGPDACWPWIAGKVPSGYGQFKIRQVSVGAHRFAWFLEHGTFPKVLACHSCDNPACCNPSHMWDGTDFDNQRDMIKKGRAPTRSHPGPKPKLQGERHRDAKLTSQQVWDIRAAYLLCRVTQRELAVRYNVHFGTINDIVRGKNWKHL